MFKRVFLFFMLLCLSLSALPASADPDYSITYYSMDILLLPDGSAEVTEKLVYDFDDDYNGILSQFDTDGIDGIDNFRIFIDGEEMTYVDSMEYENNTYSVTETGSISEVRVYSPGDSDIRTVTYEYTMLGLARRYEDAGMILRNLIGENSAVSLHDAVITVRFPGNGKIQAFAHGGMDIESITVYDNAVLFGPKTVYSGDSVEVRLLFPAEWISEAPLEKGAIMQSALAEEQRLMDEAARRAYLLRIAKYISAAAYIVLFTLSTLLMMKKYGVKGRLKEADFRRLTAWPAAFAQAAVSGAPDTDALSGTLMELVTLSRIRMEEEQKDLRFTLIDRNTVDLHPHQAALVEWLFASSDTILLSELNAGSDYARAQEFEKNYNSYLNQVTEEMITHSLKYRNDGLRISLNAVFILLGIVIGGFILLAGEGEVILGCAVIAAMFFLIFLMSKVRALTDEGELLQNAANLLIAEPIASDEALLAYLPYYTALGMTEPLIEKFSKSADDFQSAPYLYGGWYYSIHRLSSSMHDTHYHNASVPDPNASSSHHSGGGGSNGGGGGHGAW